jgi:hypothetical protein
MWTRTHILVNSSLERKGSGRGAKGPEVTDPNGVAGAAARDICVTR